MSDSGHGAFLTVLVFLLANIVTLEYAEGKQTAYACEGNILSLECEQGKVIHLIRAIYGRFSITICNENGNTEWSVNCGSPKSILVLNGTCNYERTCSVMASTKNFGDPCPGTVKYLEVQYQCIPASSLTSTTPRSPVRQNPPWLPQPGFPGEGKEDDREEILPPDIIPYVPFSNGSGKFSEEEPPKSVTATTLLPPSSTTLANIPSVLSVNPGESENEEEREENGDVTESLDWREEDRKEEVWSERTPEENPGENALGPVRGVVTVSPTVFGTGRGGGYPEEDERNRYIPPGREGRSYCETKMDRGMFWNWTAAGETAQQPCPGGASGLARWKCRRHDNSVQWYPESPDLSDCKSAWLLSLQARVLEGDRISNVASDLAQVTSTKQMYGGDIAAAVGITKTIATRMNDQLRTLTNQVSREDLAQELLGLILEAGSNLLEKTRLDPWRDLSYADQMKIATNLLVGLEDNAFLLANVINSEKTVKKSAKNILTTIYAIEANNVREINFPSESADHWGRLGDVLTMPAEALRENSDGGLVRLVCFAYNNLEHVLQPINSEGSGERRKLVNSRVISASLNQGRHIQLALPVQLTLRHLWMDNVSNPQCVFWDYTQDKWSEEGCRVVKTNRTHTQCQCTHLTNFAILMDHEPPPKHLPPPKFLQVFSYVCSAVAILCLLLTIIITHFCIHGKVFQTMILKNLFFCLLMGELIFCFGIHATSNFFGCTTIALLLHFFALASILWLFLHGFHLHLIVVEAAESGLSRQLWYYGVSYGSPAIVVLLSFLLDPRSYRSADHCWIQTSFALLCFVGPAVLVAVATAVMIIYTWYKIRALVSTMPKKPNDDKALYTYASTWLRGSFLILVLMTVSWTLRLVELEVDESPVSYASSIMVALEAFIILVFHFVKAEDMISKICDCGKGGDGSDTEMSTHSGQTLQPGQLQSSTLQPGPGGMLADPHGNHLTAQRLPDARLLTLSRQPGEGRNHEGIYAKQLVGMDTSPGFGDFGAGGMIPGGRYPGEGILGLYSGKNIAGGGIPIDGSWTRGSSYSDIRSVGFHRNDPVYEEIEKPNHNMSPRASVSDLSEDEGHMYPHDVDIYHRNIYGQQTRSLHYHPHLHGKRKIDILQGAGEAANPLLSSLNRAGLTSLHHHHPPVPSTHYTSRHRNPQQDHHHHVSLKGLHPDEHIMQNVHMV